MRSGPLFLAAAVLVLVPGTRLHVGPDASSLSVAVVDEEVEVRPVEVRDGWAFVQYLDHRGWVRPGLPRPLPRRQAESTPKPQAAPRELLADGRALLRDGGRERILERWRLFTDVEDDALLEWISRMALDAPAQFRLWWRFSAPARSGPAVFLFADSASARAFDPRACGRLGTTVVAASLVPGDPGATLRGVLHQLGHLYAFDLLGTAAPPWLEEGIADSFAAIGVKRAGLQEPMPPVATGPDGGLPDPPSMSDLFGAGPELFADDERGAAFRHEARRLARYFWNGGSLIRLGRFRAFVVGDGPDRRSLGVETFLRKTSLTLPELQRRVRSFRESPPGDLRSTDPW